jgi:hypothetical protein
MRKVNLLNTCLMGNDDCYTISSAGRSWSCGEGGSNLKNRDLGPSIRMYNGLEGHDTAWKKYHSSIVSMQKDKYITF